MINLFTDEELEEENYADLADYCTALKSNLAENENPALANYLTKQFVAEDQLQVQAAAATTTTYYVSNSARLSKLNYCGYTAGGVCGYIAAAMLLYYYDSSGQRNVIQDNNYSTRTDGTYMLQASFSRYLVEIGAGLGFGSGTTSYSIHRVVQRYLEMYGNTTSQNFSNVTHYSIFAPLIVQNAIMNHITSNRPVIIFGNMYSPSHGKTINHAVLAYGCQVKIQGSNITYSFIVHFGYNNYTNVYLSGCVMGSYYSFKCK